MDHVYLLTVTNHINPICYKQYMLIGMYIIYIYIYIYILYIYIPHNTYIHIHSYIHICSTITIISITMNVFRNKYNLLIKLM